MQPQDLEWSFEKTYPRYPFAMLVRIAVALGRWFADGRQARRLGTRRLGRLPPSRRAMKEVTKITMGRLPY